MKTFPVLAETPKVPAPGETWNALDRPPYCKASSESLRTKYLLALFIFQR